MIAADKLKSETSFREWFSLFSGKYFAMIVAYADESGTGGIPKSGKEPAPTICGLLATPETWETFRVSWKHVLSKHGADYFHFRELNKTERVKPGTHYYGWDDHKVDDFIYDMAIVAGSGPIPFGGNASVKREYGNNPTKENLQERYRATFEQFFDDFGNQMNNHFSGEKGKVSFFFDDNQSGEWISILDSVIKQKRKTDLRIGEYTPIEDTLERGMPCQAADLLVYVNRQNNETIYDRDLYVPQRILDIILSRPGYPEWHPFSVLKKLSDAEWRNLIAELRGRKKQFDLKHELAGTNPKLQYYPILCHPYFQHLYERALNTEKDTPNSGYEKFREFAQKVISVPKSEMDRPEAEFRDLRAAATLCIILANATMTATCEADVRP